MTSCPKCRAPLDPPLPHAQLCPAQHGVFLSGERLAHALPASAVARLRDAPERAGERVCPGCASAMRVRTLALDDASLHVDACTS